MSVEKFGYIAARFQQHEGSGFSFEHEQASTSRAVCIFELSRGDAVARIRVNGSRKFPLQM